MRPDASTKISERFGASRSELSGPDPRGRAFSVDSELVVQKYVEAPQCIVERPIGPAGGAAPQRRKWDLRMWALVTRWAPLEAWLYRDGYLRLCSAGYDPATAQTDQAGLEPRPSLPLSAHRNLKMLRGIYNRMYVSLSMFRFRSACNDRLALGQAGHLTNITLQDEHHRRALAAGAASAADLDAAVAAELEKLQMHTDEFMAYRPGPPGAVKRPQRFPKSIVFLWCFCMGMRGT